VLRSTSTDSEPDMAGVSDEPAAWSRSYWHHFDAAAAAQATDPEFQDELIAS